jgi:sugar lactone lactonase YvrE
VTPGTLVPGTFARDSLGGFYFTDNSNHAIRHVDATGVVTIVAGTGVAGFSGDGGLATSAQLDFPRDVALDAAGNLYLTDTGNNRIRRIDAAGVITTIAGTGVFGPLGDGGPATNASVNGPENLAFDGAGNMYVSVRGCVRKIVPAGTITTSAGNGWDRFSGLGGAATSVTSLAPGAVAIAASGDMYIADQQAPAVFHIDPSGVITAFAGTNFDGYTGDGGPATLAQLWSASSVAVDHAGNVYIADTSAFCVRRVDTAGTITTFAGNGVNGSSGDGGPATAAEMQAPWSVAVDAAGNLYISDADDNRIRRVGTDGVITTFAGTGGCGFSGDGGPATSAELCSPYGIAFDALGNLYVSDYNATRIRKITPTGTITTIAGTGVEIDSGDGGPAISASIRYAKSLAIDTTGNIYLSEESNSRIRKIDTAGTITAFAGTGNIGFTGDGAPATSVDLHMPTGVAVDAAGHLYIADPKAQVVRRVDTTGIVTTVAGQVDPPGMGPFGQAHLADPRAIVVTPSFTLFAGGTSGTIQGASGSSVEAVAGRYYQDVATGTLARFRDPNFGNVGGVAYDATGGFIYLTESSADRIHVITMVDPADPNTWTIAPFANVSGTDGFGDGAAATATFRNPTGLYLDTTMHVLYVADTGNHVVRAIDLGANTVSTIIGKPATRGYFGDGGSATSALLFAPEAITRCTNGDLFVADTGNNRIRRVAASTNVISTVLGDGTAASSGEGEPATSFPVDAPRGLACDALGNLFVTSTSTVRLVPADANGIVDGSGAVHTIYGAPPATSFPASVTRCLTGLAVVDATSIEITDSCSGLLVALHRAPKP